MVPGRTTLPLFGPQEYYRCAAAGLIVPIQSARDSGEESCWQGYQGPGGRRSISRASVVTLLNAPDRGRELTRKRRPRARIAVLVVGFLAGSVCGPIGHPSVVNAAQPTPKRCQEGFLQAAPPKHDAVCPSADAAEPVVGGRGPRRLPGERGLVRAGQSGRGPVRGRRSCLRRREERRHQDLRQPHRPDADDVQRAACRNVHNFWDRGMLGFALDPSLTGGPGNGLVRLRALRVRPHPRRAPARATWGDACPSRRTARPDHRRLRRQRPALALRGQRQRRSPRAEQVLIEDWCQQFPSHSVGSLVFGPDGALYVSGGDGASFNFVDYGPGRRDDEPDLHRQEPVRRPTERCDDATDGGGRRAALAGPPHDLVRRRHRLPRRRCSPTRPFAYWRFGEASGTAVDDRSGREPARTSTRRPWASRVRRGDGNTAVRAQRPPTGVRQRPRARRRFRPRTAPFESRSEFERHFRSATSSYRRWSSRDSQWQRSGALLGRRRPRLRSVDEHRRRAAHRRRDCPSRHPAGITSSGRTTARTPRLYVDGGLVVGPTAKTLVGRPTSTILQGRPVRRAVADSIQRLARRGRRLQPGAVGGRGRGALRRAARVSGHRRAGQPRRRDPARQPGDRRGLARQPVRRRAPMRTPGGSSPTASATRSGSVPAGDERALGRRRRLEHLGGAQPDPQRDRRRRRELRLALLRGRRQPGRL